MKIKQIMGASLMVIFTICLIAITAILPIITNLNSNKLLSIMSNSNFMDNTDIATEKVLINYLTEENAKKVLEKINPKSDIKKIVLALENNAINKEVENIKNNAKQEIINVLGKDIDSASKESFATTVSNEYVKVLFPVTEFGVISAIYNKFYAKLMLAAVILSVICIAIYMYLALGKKTYKWAIIGIYNAIIITIIMLVAINMLNGIVVGNERTTALIMNVIASIKTYIVIEIILMIIIAVLANYKAYFKQRRYSKQ